jgi:GAF domain-containing protein
MTQRMDEFARQRALDTYRIVDSLPDAAYDDIVRLASTLCGVPMALVSLIDRERQWFKASVGFEVSETRRDEAFCDHAIRSPDALMEVVDAHADARFADNPLVVGGPQIRYYAGVPLVTPGGAPIGTVCVLDREPRALNPQQHDALASLARLTMNLLEGRHRERELERAALLASVPVEPMAASAPAVEARGYTVAIFELQHLAAANARLGERALERAMQQLDHDLDACLRRGSGDCVNRASGSAESIIVLHGDDVDATLQELRAVLPAFERQTGLQVLSAAAAAGTPHEPVGQVFVRADEALSRIKDERHAAARAH